MDVSLDGSTEGGLFAFAGLWSTWRSPEGDDITSYTIITTEPNELVAKIHNRMPVILTRDDQEHWLSNDRDSADLLTPYAANDMEAYPSTSVSATCATMTPS